MLYKFKSPATGDLIMLGPNGDQMLRLLGREPAPRGIIETVSMAAAIAALQSAITDAEAPAAADADNAAEAGDEGAGRNAVGLRQRLWPMVEMLRRAQAAGEPVTWGT